MRFIDSYFYKPNLFQKALAIALLPLSALYLLIATLRRKLQKYRDFGIPIISIGNLVAGGSGKTPFLQEIVLGFPKDAAIAVISRGYKRKSKGLIVVSQKGEILATQAQSGDEAYMLALNLPNASVIVAKNRKLGILKAKELGAKCVFLDDGFRFNFNKLNIILVPQLEPHFRFPLPSGIYRENPLYANKGDLFLKDGVDYTREVVAENPTERMLLLTAIANPARLRAFLPPNIVGEIILGDHSDFDLAHIRAEFARLNATSLLVTAKDEVKLRHCDLPLSVLRLTIIIKPEVREIIKRYIHISTQNAESSAESVNIYQ